MTGQTYPDLIFVFADLDFTTSLLSDKYYTYPDKHRYTSGGSPTEAVFEDKLFIAGMQNKQCDTYFNKLFVFTDCNSSNGEYDT